MYFSENNDDYYGNYDLINDFYGNNYDTDNYDNNNKYDTFMSPDPLKDVTNYNKKIDKNPVPKFPQQSNAQWPSQLNDAFKKMDMKKNNYMGLHTNLNPQSQVSEFHYAHCGLILKLRGHP